MSHPRGEEDDQRTRVRLFGAVFLASGAGLAVYILAGVSLAVTGAVLGAAGALTSVAVWRRSTPPTRSRLRRAMRVGVVAGVLATAAYDATRYAIVWLFDTTIWPFEAFPLFGGALLGAGSEGSWVALAGTAYHVLNGVGFAIAYTVWFGERGPLAGIGFALALEAAMLTLYPTWLDVRALREFVGVSVLGHFAYGSVLGAVAAALSQRPERLTREVAR